MRYKNYTTKDQDLERISQGFYIKRRSVGLLLCLIARDYSIENRERTRAFEELILQHKPSLLVPNYI